MNIADFRRRRMAKDILLFLWLFFFFRLCSSFLFLCFTLLLFFFSSSVSQRAHSEVLHLFLLYVSPAASARFVGLYLQSLLVTSIHLFHCRLLFICPSISIGNTDIWELVRHPNACSGGVSFSIPFPPIPNGSFPLPFTLPGLI